MCVSFFCLNHFSEFPLAVFHNRDEYYSRRFGEWSRDSEVSFAQDLKEGGTWLAVSNRGKIAVVYNYRTQVVSEKTYKSRGSLPLKFLQEPSHDQFFRFLKENSPQYRPFNIVYGDVDEIFFFTFKNHETRKIDARITGVSNGLISDKWPKVKRGETLLKETRDSIKNFNDLASLGESIMTDKTFGPEHKLPNTGFPREIEKALSPIFVSSPNYGTVLTQILAWDLNGDFHYTDIKHINNDQNQ